ncbi:MAG: Ig-like domain-containing protein [Xanthomonadales bacterium]|nr:Ig-like domain-containing protein [Xanthomonadales bacterium]
MLNLNRVMATLLGMVAVLPAFAEEAERDDIHSDAASMSFIGDQYRVGIGWGSETDLTGEFFWSFAEKPDSAWVAEGWFGDESAGGLKLNYHWLADGVEAGVNQHGETVFSDGKVRKLFLAGDRNEWDDRKLTFGGGSERDNRFWSLYGSIATTGERFIGQQIDAEDLLVTGMIGNHAFSRVDTLETITDFYAHPYDWGVGFRVGRYFENQMVRLRGGIDYEEGDYDSSQVTLFASLDKRFDDSRFGFSLRAEALHKSGDFETDENDARITALLTGDFGRSFRPTRVYRDVAVERVPDASELPREDRVEVIENRVTMDSTATFALDSAELNESARQSLDGVIRTLGNTEIVGKIQIVGHTCSLGTDQYNQDLSERRAKTVFDYLVAHGVKPELLQWEGRGESQPRFSNETEESRKRNRRVELAFTATEEVVREVIVGEGQPITEWVQEAVAVEAAWIRRALRNPVAHKRSVDYYRINRVSQNLIEGETMVENTVPVAVDDMYTVDQDSAANALQILTNDSDPEDDILTIVSVTDPANGTVEISGGTILYTPDPGFFGMDSFSYTIDDGFGGMDSATVMILVQRANELPDAVDDAYVVPEDSVANELDVLANDSDPDGDSLTIVSVSSPTNGTASIAGDKISYTPNPGFFGTDTFTYTIDDGFQGQDTATVTVTVEESNEPPVAVDDYARTLKGYPEVIDVLANDFDPDGDPLTVVDIIQSAHPMGFVVINGDGTLTYTPMAGWWGGDSFQYVVSDGRGGTATGTVTIDVVTLISKP